LPFNPAVFTLSAANLRTVPKIAFRRATGFQPCYPTLNLDCGGLRKPAVKSGRSAGKSALSKFHIRLHQDIGHPKGEQTQYFVFAPPMAARTQYGVALLMSDRHSPITREVSMKITVNSLASSLAAFFFCLSESSAQSGWFTQTSGTTKDLLRLAFTDANTGIAVGNTGTILRTTDGGVTWTKQPSGTLTHLPGVSFCNLTTGWVVGASGTILRTTNGGATWTKQLSGTTNLLNSVSCTDANTATSVGMLGTILHTTDGGASWTEQSSGVTVTLNSVSFTDANTGTAVGDGGTILRTVNGGSTWTKQTSHESARLLALSFGNASTCTAVGEFGIILRTTDGGATWTSQSGGIAYDLWEVSFTDANTGTAVGASGSIVRTTNGGATWTRQSSGTISTLYGVSFTSANIGTAVGEGGVILRTTSGGVTWVEENRQAQVPLQFSLNQNFPNPFNPATTIKFQVPSSGHVTLKVYAVLGQELATLVNQELTPGDYSVTWNAAEFASGVYLYRLQAGEFVRIRKLVLQK
jgi:photosystem II stability/assembly factor-like uncharacterized protein